MLYGERIPYTAVFFSCFVPLVLDTAHSVIAIGLSSYPLNFVRDRSGAFQGEKDTDANDAIPYFALWNKSKQRQKLSGEMGAPKRKTGYQHSLAKRPEMARCRNARTSFFYNAIKLFKEKDSHVNDGRRTGA